MEVIIKSVVVEKIANNLQTSKWKIDFFIILISTILSLKGKVNFRNMSRYSNLDEKSFSRNYRKQLDFKSANIDCIDYCFGNQPDRKLIAAMDCSFIPKSGKKTSGLDYFYSGCASRTLKGLEISGIAIVDVDSRECLSLDVKQTPASSKTEEKNENRMDFYHNQLESCMPEFLRLGVRHVALDGAYAKKNFVTKTRKTGIEIISKLRRDCRLKYIYQGAPTGKKGRPKEFDGAVKFTDLSRFKHVGKTSDGDKIYEAIVYSVSLKCKIKLALIEKENIGKKSFVILFSTDLNLPAMDIYKYYAARFQIEFIFRDAKQNTGLCDCQSTNQDSLNFHFNASLTALNCARAEHYKKNENKPFSIESIKRANYNDMFLNLILSKLDLKHNLIKNEKIYQQLVNFGVIAA